LQRFGLAMTETRFRQAFLLLVDQPGEFDSPLRTLPGYHRIEPYRAQILTKAGELVGSTSAFLFAALSATTRATAVFIFHFFALLGGRGLASDRARRVLRARRRQRG
jgi:predicted PurR-regulated permease PerM